MAPHRRADSAWTQLGKRRGRPGRDIEKEKELSRFLPARSDGQADIRRACGVTQLGTAQGHGEIDDAIHARPL